MTKEAQKDLSIKVSVNTVVTTLVGILLSAFIIGISTRIEKLQIEQAELRTMVQQILKSKTP